jgi:hypothetical protein
MDAIFKLTWHKGGQPGIHPGARDLEDGVQQGITYAKPVCP